MALFIHTPDRLDCAACAGSGEAALPDSDGRIRPWSRIVFCPACLGTGLAACGCCGAPGAATHLDASGHPECASCAGGEG